MKVPSQVTGRPLIFGALVVAIIVAGVSISIDSWLFSRKQSDFGLSWARQIATQAEGLALYARQSGVKDSLGWAASFLSQGAEPRTIQVTKVETARAEPEFYRLEENTFDYVKISMPEKGQGIRIKIFFPFRGFLDTRSQLTHDFMIFAFVGLLLLAIMGLASRKVMELQNARLAQAILKEEEAWKFADEAEVRRVKEVQDTKDQVKAWSGTSKAALMGLGLHVRDLVKEANHLALSAAKSRDAVQPLRNKVHATLRDLREKRRKLKDDDLDAASKKVLDVFLRELEIAFEPLASEADLAVQAYAEVFESTNLLNQAITETKGSVINQAKLLQSIEKAA